MQTIIWLKRLFLFKPYSNQWIDLPNEYCLIWYSKQIMIVYENKGVFTIEQISISTQKIRKLNFSSIF